MGRKKSLDGPSGKPIDIKWTKHGRRRAKERGVTGREVRRLVEKPTVLRKQDGGRIRVEGRVGGRWIVVVYVASAINQVRIVTTFPKDE